MPKFRVKYGNGQSVVIEAASIEDAREKAHHHARTYHVGGVNSVKPKGDDMHWKCKVCPFTTSDEDAARGHISRKGWLGKGETHSLSHVRGPRP